MPAWANGPVDEWVSIPNTQLLAAMTDPNPGGSKAFITSYCGAALHPDTLDLYVIGGGHASYAGNEAYKLVLDSEQPTWVKLSSPTSGQLYDPIAFAADPKGFPYYLDGRPSARHTWDAIHVIPERNAVCLFGAGAVWGNGNGGFPNVDAWDIGTRDYVARGAFRDCPFQTAGMLCVKDAEGNVSIQEQSGSAAIYKWTIPDECEVKANGGVHNYATACYDSLRNRVVRFPDNRNAPINGRYWSCSGPVVPTSFMFSSAPTGSWQGYVRHDPFLDRYLFLPKRGFQFVVDSPRHLGRVPYAGFRGPV